MPARVPETELELKFEVGGTFEPPAQLHEGGVESVDELEPLELKATYYDTADLRLARSGTTLRHRTGDREGPGWQLKLPAPGRDGAGGFEHRMTGSANHIPAQARRLVTALARSEQLVAVGRLRTRRRGWSLKDAAGRELAELVEDNVSVMRKRRVVDMFHEVELEAKTDDLADLEGIAEALKASGAVPSAGVPKIVRALGARALAPPDASGPSSISARDPAGVAVQAALATGVQRVIVNDSRARLGHAEGVHQMRVAARRLRSDLRTFGPLLQPGWAEPIIGELRSLGNVLGEVRDLDVLQANLLSSAVGLERELEPLWAELRLRHGAASARLGETLEGVPYKDLLERLTEAAHAPALMEGAGAPCEEVLPPLVAATWKELEKRAKQVGRRSSDADLHKVRIRAKRTRYAAEAVAPALGPRKAEAAKFADLAAALQNVLGRHHDAVVATGVVAATAAAGDRGFCLAAGRLIERQLAVAAAARSELKPVWSKLDRKKRRSWLS